MSMKPQSGQTASRRSDALANRAKVLQAAQEVFGEQGLATEVKDIAERAGVGVATIYRGFGSKDELLEATIEQADTAVSDLLAVAEACPEPVEGLRQLISGLLGFAESYGWLIQASMAGDIRRTPASLRRRTERRRRATRLIEQAVHSGAIPLDLPVDVIKLLVDGAVYALTFRSHRQEPHPAAAEITNGLVLLLTSTPGAKNRP
jgi:AcrR family transcriptional regulator